MSIFIATCGPTGVGKTFQMQRLIKSDRRRFTPVLSVTTRARRDAEDGEWYRFVSREEIANFDTHDVISNVEFRGERYLLLHSEIEKALARAPIAFMAIVPPVIELMRGLGIKHALIRCKAADPEGYKERLRKRGFTGEDLKREAEVGLSFKFPVSDPDWPEREVIFGSDRDDNELFDKAVSELAGPLFSKYA